jgi:hypothetical protein
MRLRDERYPGWNGTVLAGDGGSKCPLGTSVAALRVYCLELASQLKDNTGWNTWKPAVTLKGNGKSPPSVALHGHGFGSPPVGTAAASGI